jgi:hypothetical protein
MILTGENRSNRRKACHFIHHKSNMQWPWDRTRPSAVTGWWIIAWGVPTTRDPCRSKVKVKFTIYRPPRA